VKCPGNVQIAGQLCPRKISIACNVFIEPNLDTGILRDTPQHCVELYIYTAGTCMPLKRLFIQIRISYQLAFHAKRTAFYTDTTQIAFSDNHQKTWDKYRLWLVTHLCFNWINNLSQIFRSHCERIWVRIIISQYRCKTPWQSVKCLKWKRFSIINCADNIINGWYSSVISE